MRQEGRMSPLSAPPLIRASPLSAPPLIRAPPLGGRQRFPAWLVSGGHRVSVYGLSRGGTAVLDQAGEQVIDSAGAVFAAPGADEVRAWMNRHAVQFADHVG
jgi:hypothetical protein